MSKNVIVKNAGNKGKGVFALKNFKKNEVVLYVDGKLVETEHPSSFSKDIRDHWYPIERIGKKHVYILPKSPWMYINHSCEPNAGIKNNRNIVAMKSIRKGDEITIDYTMNNIDNWRMKCNCGSKKCRKIIGTFEMLDEKTQKKYLPYVTEWTKKQYKKFKKNNVLKELFGTLPKLKKVNLKKIRKELSPEI